MMPLALITMMPSVAPSIMLRVRWVLALSSFVRSAIKASSSSWERVSAFVALVPIFNVNKVPPKRRVNAVNKMAQMV